jgi:hypothetical protein
MGQKVSVEVVKRQSGKGNGRNSFEIRDVQLHSTLRKIYSESIQIISGLFRRSCVSTCASIESTKKGNKNALLGVIHPSPPPL